MRNKFMYFIVFICIFSGCVGMHKEHLLGRYYLISTDYVREEICISYKVNDDGYVGILCDVILSEIGFNQDYIFVKARRRHEEGPIKHIYYIVPIKKKYTFSPEEGVLGPMTIEEFNAKVQEMGIIEKNYFTKKVSL